ncbi:MAG: Fic family protein [Planctomycetia bacterium]|nr:Fic family protein [Planctomycetia bacterium]
MVFIHENEGWPRFSWDAAAVLPVLGRARHKQGLLLGRMRHLGFAFQAEAAVEVLTSDVVRSSAIEGERLDADAVRSSIARRLGLPQAGARRANRNVEGIVEVMLDATRNASHSVTAERLCGWHAALFPVGYSGTRPIAVGRWRTVEAGPMQVVSGPLGRERVHFEAPAAERLPGEMAAFIAWCNTEDGQDPLLRAAIAHLWFVTIHPFEDGNGRLARALADMMLARADGCPDRFYSMSTQIETERKEYYQILECTQRGDGDITAWLDWFLGCLERAIDQAHLLTAGVLRKAEVWRILNGGPPVNDRQRLVVNRLLDDFKGGLTTTKYAKLATCSADTALRDIQDLVARGVLVRSASGGRSTSYRLDDRRPE